jgi:ABC-type nitrate/sulfonate/bicarbonate transport system ATPase subunit
MDSSSGAGAFAAEAAEMAEMAKAEKKQPARLSQKMRNRVLHCRI